MTAPGASSGPFHCAALAAMCWTSIRRIGPIDGYIHCQQAAPGHTPDSWHHADNFQLYKRGAGCPCDGNDKPGKRDYPVLMGLTFIAAVLVLFSNLIADILYAVADPRIRHE